MTIIVLSGKANSGKSTVIRGLVDRLLTDGGQFICQKDADRFTSNYNFTLPFLYKNVLIAITSLGDDWNTIEKVFKNYVNYIPIMICAAHPSPPYKRRFDELKIAGHIVIEVPILHSKDIPSETEVENKYANCEEELFNQINETITSINGGK